MKFLLVVLFLFSFSVFSDVVGTWAYSGSGCRDESLSPESHRSKAPNEKNPIAEAVFTFERDGTARMEAVFQDRERQTERGTYTLRGDRLTIPQWAEAIFTVMGDRIILLGDSISEVSPCRRGEVFVYILSPVD